MKLEQPNCWMIAINKAMIGLHNRFKHDPKFILTESDLKCWLFYELQEVNNNTFSVHTEITHYPYSKAIQNGITVKVQKFFFRDLTILDEANVIENEKLWNDSNDNYVLSKGFKHRGPAVHFELKLVRQAINENTQPIINANDIQKLKKYCPEPSKNKRRFVIVWCSRNENVRIDNLEDHLSKSLQGFNKENLNDVLDFYLFDKEILKHFSWKNNQLTLNE